MLRIHSGRWGGALGTIVGILMLASTAQGALINVGDTLFPAPGEADPAGPFVVVASLSQPFNAGTFSGVLTSEVLTGDTSNPFGGVTFTYRVSNSPNSQNVEARLTVNGYTGWQTDGGYQIPLSGLRPALADRQTADVVGFSFLAAPLGVGPIQPGQQSTLLVIQTNAPTWTGSFASVIDGSVATIPTFGPAPEPATLSLLALSALAMIRRRR